MQNYLSRNFYNLRFLALFLAFALNFILLFYKVRETRFNGFRAVFTLVLMLQWLRA